MREEKAVRENIEILTTEERLKTHLGRRNDPMASTGFEASSSLSSLSETSLGGLDGKYLSPRWPQRIFWPEKPLNVL